MDDFDDAVPALVPRRRVSPGGLVAALFGAALFAYTVQQTGLDPIVSGMRSVGWGFLAILALSGLRMVVRALAWSLCTEGPQPLRLRDTFPAFVTGDALGNLTPLGLFASETAKTMFVRHRVPLMTALSGLAIENLIYSLTVAADDLGGRGGAAPQLHVSRPLQVLSVAAVAGMMLVLAATAWVLTRQVRVISGLIDWLDRHALAPGRVAHRLENLRTLEDRVYGFHRRHPDRLLPVLALEGVYHAAGVAEIYVTLAWLAVPPTIIVAFILETFNRLTQRGFQIRPDAPRCRRSRLGPPHHGAGLHERDGRDARDRAQGARCCSGRASACCCSRGAVWARRWRRLRWRRYRARRKWGRV